MQPNKKRPACTGKGQNGSWKRQNSHYTPPPYSVQAITGSYRRQALDYARINQGALTALPALLMRWLPGGVVTGHEYTVCNPKRADHRPGSFKINLYTGKWADFALPDAKGGDVAALLSEICMYAPCVGFW